MFNVSFGEISCYTVAYTHEHTDSSYVDVVMTRVMFCWSPLYFGLCGFHYETVVSISPDFSRQFGTETDFNPGWTLSEEKKGLSIWTVQTKTYSLWTKRERRYIVKYIAFARQRRCSITYCCHSFLKVGWKLNIELKLKMTHLCGRLYIHFHYRLKD